MNELIKDAFQQAVDADTTAWKTAIKTDRQIRRDANLLMKSLEPVLEHLCEHGFETMTIQELYNEISGQAHLG